MQTETGNISVNTENIFPIIRKWLYSDRDIFVRELVSNAADALAKLKRLGEIGEYVPPEEEQPEITVELDTETWTLSVEDIGIGMTEDEVRRYINQIAYSGVMEFVEKYKDKGAESSGIIGHFGLGFYSSFMVSDKVRIDTLSFEKGAEAVSWESEDGMAYVLGPSGRGTHGTRVTLTISEDNREFMTGAKVREILEKYCGFMPFPIYFRDISAEKKAEKADKESQAEQAGPADQPEQAEQPETRNPINDVSPLWLKNPRDCTDEEYKAFFRKTFRDYRDPLFWIHLNMDYPFNLKGILYFPQTDNVYESLEGRIKIYYNQVFVADNIKEIIPEFLFLLKGCIDCPDLPLNVSRSFLQNDTYVGKLSAHIIRKVADKLSQLFQSQRPEYEKYWQDIGVFVKYGMMREEKFYEKVKDIALFKTVDGDFKVLSDLGDTLIYTTDAGMQVAYVQMAKSRGLTVLVMDHEIDNHFMSFIEYQNHGKHFKRVDAELGGSEVDHSRADTLAKLFRDASGREKLEVKIQSLGGEALPAMISESEESRRMQEMRKQFERMQGGAENKASVDDMFPLQQILVVNQDQPLVSRILALADIPGQEDQARLLARQVYDLARLGHGSLSSDELAEFLKRSVALLGQVKPAEPGT
jgi:molecular chaperone HtpG